MPGLNGKEHALAPPALTRALDRLAAIDADIARARAAHGDPPPRAGAAGFQTLLRILIGQQLSTKAAQTIADRLAALLGGETAPGALLARNDDELRGIGLSRQKVAYARALAEAVSSGRFDPHGLGDLDDDAAIAAITAHKGFGVWSAQMYLMFSLGRADIWPIGDLGVREGLRRIKNLDVRPDERQAAAIGEAWSPHRSAAAMMCWHVLHNMPA
ncbi:MAG: DNA-3-methyladenine glycosylase 2 family protein [Alphaproteobacteria bacterium]|nr:MAG: DNA-3-methyladenine glycosylase 2 family protein [Alphaproteobacteria bacterium]